VSLLQSPNAYNFHALWDRCTTLLLVSRNLLETNRHMTLKMKSDVCDSDLRDTFIRLDLNTDSLLSLKAAGGYHSFRTDIQHCTPFSSSTWQYLRTAGVSIVARQKLTYRTRPQLLEQWKGPSVFYPSPPASLPQLHGTRVDAWKLTAALISRVFAPYTVEPARSLRRSTARYFTPSWATWIHVIQ